MSGFHVRLFPVRHFSPSVILAHWHTRASSVGYVHAPDRWQLRIWFDYRGTESISRHAPRADRQDRGKDQERPAAKLSGHNRPSLYRINIGPGGSSRRQSITQCPGRVAIRADLMPSIRRNRRVTAERTGGRRPSRLLITNFSLTFITFFLCINFFLFLSKGSYWATEFLSTVLFDFVFIFW